MKFIYVRGSDKNAPIVAKYAGMKYGIRHDCKPYAKPHMLDVNWKAYNWHEVMSLVFEFSPNMVLVPDFEHPSQLSQVLQRVAHLQNAGIPEILVCPKFPGAIEMIPLFCTIAVSMPAPNYETYLPDFRKLRGRKVHLLGGRPDSTKTRLGQFEAIRQITGHGGEVVSLDGNYLALRAMRGSWFENGKWMQTRNRKTETIELAKASATNIMKTILAIKGQKQLPLKM